MVLYYSLSSLYLEDYNLLIFRKGTHSAYHHSPFPIVPLPITLFLSLPLVLHVCVGDLETLNPIVHTDSPCYGIHKKKRA